MDSGPYVVVRCRNYSRGRTVDPVLTANETTFDGSAADRDRQLVGVNDWMSSCADTYAVKIVRTSYLLSASFYDRMSRRKRKETLPTILIDRLSRLIAVVTITVEH